MTAIPEMPKPRLAGAVLCAAAALLLLLCSMHLFTAGGGRGGATSLLLVGLGLAAAAVKSFRPQGRRG